MGQGKEMENFLDTFTLGGGWTCVNHSGIMLDNDKVFSWTNTAPGCWPTCRCWSLVVF